jgi:MerR family transcriptional regulator, repressor of the yfmOP operon
MEWLKIDDVAKKTGLTKRTIRYYEQIGLIYPPERSEGKTRLYTEEDVERLKKVIDARDVLGFSLQELKDYIEFKERIDSYQKDYKHSADKEQKLEKVKQIQSRLEVQLNIMDEKIKKMKDFQSEMNSLHQRVQAFLEQNQ